ncbi:MAG: hypothetical protein Q7S92_00735 [Candidatus Diapherotrites archaeon]|nr:hypothetical protein [Candidatus Diapherotrites archaeon]
MKTIRNLKNLYLAELEDKKNQLLERLSLGKSNKRDRNALYEVLGVMDYKARISQERILPISECF